MFFQDVALKKCEEMLNQWRTNARSISTTDQECGVWNSGVTQHDIRALERVKRTAVAIMRGDSHTNYQAALEYFQLNTLEDRREDICLKFAVKAYGHPKFSFWFSKNSNTVNTRSERIPLMQIGGRTGRYQKSPLPYLTDLLNTNLMAKKNPIMQQDAHEGYPRITVKHDTAESEPYCFQKRQCLVVIFIFTHLLSYLCANINIQLTWYAYQTLNILVCEFFTTNK